METDFTHKNDANGNLTTPEPSFLPDHLLNTSKKRYTVEQKRHMLLECIRKNPAKTVYYYATQTKMNYATVHQALKELVFCRLVAVKQGFDHANQPCEVFFIPGGAMQ